ncbi:MAG: DHA2 family efflux MFS transporter permease subunit [Acidobacteriota bacterium]|nr:DHA2 family efflux MFS transporter permease subunit [Acidobacteriota bacterium]
MATTPAASHEKEWRPSHNHWLVALTVTLATFMEVLDTSIANVALPHIAGSVGASQDEATWVLTSYLVSNAVILPISAWLATRFGRKRFYMSSVAVFTISSVLCGLAPNLALLVFFRILQGVGGGGLAPSEQAILADTFPANQRGLGFAVYGMAVVIAPAIGPTIGGWITDNYSWHWIFFINLPIGILSLFLTHRMVQDPPYLKREQQRVSHSKSRVDYTGFALIALGIGALQLVLDKGQEADWFSSGLITVTAIFAAVTLVAWAIWEWHQETPIVNVRLFSGRNFATAMLFTFVLGMVLNGTTVLLPQFLQSLLGYDATKAGEAMAGGGFIMMLMMPLAGFMVSRVDPRMMMGFGFATTSAALYFMATHLTTGMDFRTAATLRTLQTAGLAFIFLPSNTLAYVGIPREQNNQVSGMNAFVRNIGGSIGIALLSTMLTRFGQQNQSTLVRHTHTGNPAFQNMVQGISRNLQNSGVEAATATQQAYARVMAVLRGQAATLAYVHVIMIMAIVVACLIPLPMIMRKPPKGKPAGDVAMH